MKALINRPKIPRASFVFIRYAKENPESIGEVDISDVIDVFTMSNLNLVNVPPKLIPMLKEAHMKSLLSNDAFHLLTMEYLRIKEYCRIDLRDAVCFFSELNKSLRRSYVRLHIGHTIIEL